MLENFISASRSILWNQDNEFAGNNLSYDSSYSAVKLLYSNRENEVFLVEIDPTTLKYCIIALIIEQKRHQVKFTGTSYIISLVVDTEHRVLVLADTTQVDNGL